MEGYQTKGYQKASRIVLKRDKGRVSLSQILHVISTERAKDFVAANPLSSYVNEEDIQFMLHLFPDQERIYYKEYTSLVSTLSGRMPVYCFPVTLFFQLPLFMDETGAYILKQDFTVYIHEFCFLLNVYSMLLEYIKDPEMITITEYTEYLRDTVKTIPFSSILSPDFLPFYISHIAESTFFFASDKESSPVSSLPLTSLLLSSALRHYCILSPSYSSYLTPISSLYDPYSSSFYNSNRHSTARAIENNWFSHEEAFDIYSCFVQLDIERKGFLSVDNLMHYNGGGLTRTFLSSCVKEYGIDHQFFDYKAFVVFTAAYHHLASHEGLSYYFHAMKPTINGSLDEEDINAYLVDSVSTVNDILLDGAGNLLVEEILEEILAALPIDERGKRITLEQLESSEKAPLIMMILTDANALLLANEKKWFSMNKKLNVCFAAVLWEDYHYENYHLCQSLFLFKHVEGVFIRYAPYQIIRCFSGKQNVFDRNILIAHRDTIAKRSDFDHYSYLRNDVIENLTDRLLDINRSFPVTIDLGCWDGRFVNNLQGRGGIKTVYECDPSFNMLQRARKNYENNNGNKIEKPTYIQINEEFLPFRNISK